MTTKIQYNGTAPIYETAITGKQQKWFPGQRGDVSDADAALLKASGLGFGDPSGDPPSSRFTDAQCDALESLVSGAGNYALAAPPSPMADMTQAIYDAIDATPEYGTLILPYGEIAISDEIVIEKSISIRGAGCVPITGAWAVSGAFDSPGVEPYLAGTVLAQKSAAKNVLRFTVPAGKFDLNGFGIRFDAGRFTNTGNGVVAQAGAFGSGSEHGMFYSEWNDIGVFGHDGNHYAFKLVNPLHSRVSRLRSWGGGGVHVQCDSYAGNYGNLLMDAPFVHLFSPGVAHGYCMEGRTSGQPQGVLNLIVALRPQCNSTDQTARFGVSASSSQRLWTSNVGGISANAVSIIGPDFETTVSGTCDFGNGTKFVDPSGIFGASGDTASKTFTVMRSAVGNKVLNSDMTLSNRNNPSPTVAAGVGAGTGATATISGDDEVGTITLSSGTGPSAYAALFTVTFGRLSASGAIMLSPRNGTAGKIRTYVANRTSSGWTVNSADLAVDATATLIWDYHLIR